MIRAAVRFKHKKNINDSLKLVRIIKVMVILNKIVVILNQIYQFQAQMIPINKTRQVYSSIMPLKRQVVRFRFLSTMAHNFISFMLLLRLFMLCFYPHFCTIISKIQQSFSKAVIHYFQSTWRFSSTAIKSLRKYDSLRFLPVLFYLLPNLSPQPIIIKISIFYLYT